MSAPLAHRTSAHLEPDPSRVVTHLFLPGEQLPHERSRVGGIADRVMALDEDEVARLAGEIVSEFAGRHPDLPASLIANAAIVASRVDGARLTAARTLVLGASVTAEYATESAALCNPSAVEHPDQTGLEPGQLRAAVSLRAIGEGHVSSISFCAAVIGPGPRWSFADRDLPIVAGRTAPSLWRSDHLQFGSHEPRITGLRRFLLGRAQVIENGFRLVNAVLFQDRSRIGEGGCVGDGRTGSNHGRVVAGNIGDGKRDHPRRCACRGKPASLHCGKMFAHAIHLGDVRSAFQQRLVDSLLVRKRESRRR